MCRYRRFAVVESATAQDWDLQVESAEQWTLGNLVGVGEALSRHAIRNDGLRAFAKPAFQSVPFHIPRAANEKIVADLAFAAGVPVPPVVLWQEPTTGDRFALSCRAFRQPLTWREALPHLSAQYREALAPILTLGYVFHTWIGDRDHYAHPLNLLVDAEASSDAPAIAFIDHAWSMLWPSADEALVGPHAYYLDPVAMRPDHVKHAVELLERMLQDAVRRIVERVPGVYLQASARGLIVDGLLRRQSKLRHFFGVA